MKNLTLVLVISCFVCNLFSQDFPCDYIPLEFEEAEPMWSRLQIDSTFIGHVDTTLASGQWDQFYKDGMTQFSWDGGSFLKGNFLYSIINVDYDRDLSGYFIEKIDFETGEMMWQIRTDLRHVDDREKAMGFKIEDGKFVMYGVRTFWDEIDLKVNYVSVGFIPTYFFMREYSNETGELINHYTPTSIESPFELNSNNTRDYLFQRSETEFDYINKLLFLDEGLFMLRTKMNDKGFKIGETDTVYYGAYNAYDYNEAFLANKQYFYKGYDSYFLVDQFNPMPSSTASLEGKVVKFDYEFNILKEWDISDLEIDAFSILEIVKEIDGKVILKGCYNTNPNFFCELFYIILDEDLNFLEKIDGKFNNDDLLFPSFKSMEINYAGQLVMIDRELNDEGQSNLEIYQSNDSGSMDSKTRLTIKQEKWVGFCDVGFRLENGDYLFKVNHSCYIDGSKRSWHPEWFRFKAEDINLLSSNEEIIADNNVLEIFPNPTDGNVNVTFEKSFDGRVELYNSVGIKVFSRDVGLIQNSLDFNLEKMPSGYYVVKLIGRNGEVFGLGRIIRL